MQQPNCHQGRPVLISIRMSLIRALRIAKRTVPGPESSSWASRVPHRKSRDFIYIKILILHPVFSIEIGSPLEGPWLLELGLRAEFLFLLVDVAVKARERLASLVSYRGLKSAPSCRVMGAQPRRHSDFHEWERFNKGVRSRSPQVTGTLTTGVHSTTPL